MLLNSWSDRFWQTLQTQIGLLLEEQSIKGLIDAAPGARMSVGEALTNLVFARVTDLKVRL